MKGSLFSRVKYKYISNHTNNLITGKGNDSKFEALTSLVLTEKVTKQESRLVSLIIHELLTYNLLTYTYLFTVTCLYPIYWLIRGVGLPLIYFGSRSYSVCIEILNRHLYIHPSPILPLVPKSSTVLVYVRLRP